MHCQRCASGRMVAVCAKTSDRCNVDTAHSEHRGYVPEGLNIGSDDYLEFALCLNCGHVDGEWPVPAHDIEKSAVESS